MSLLKISMFIGLAVCFVHHVHTMDFNLMNFARDTVMEYSGGTERTVNILQPKLNIINQRAPVNPPRRKTTNMPENVTKIERSPVPLPTRPSMKRITVNPSYQRQYMRNQYNRNQYNRRQYNYRRQYNRNQQNRSQRRHSQVNRSNQRQYMRNQYNRNQYNKNQYNRNQYNRNQYNRNPYNRNRYNRNRYNRNRYNRILNNRRPTKLYYRRPTTPSMKRPHLSFKSFPTVESRVKIPKRSGTSKSKLTFIKRTKTYRRRTKPSNKFLEAMATIERAVAEAEATGSKMNYSDENLQAIKKTIKLAVDKRMYQFARQRLGQALFLIKEHSSSPTSRSRRSTQNQASTFMNDLKRTLGSAQFDQFMAVMGDVTLMFAIDTTGSMSDEIDTAKRIAVDVINYPRENPVNYILSPFSDPATGPVIFRDTTEGALFVDAINKLKAKGGGDCPELTMKGILDALYEGPDPGSPLYVFTDASAKDATPENINEVKSMAKFLGKVVINFFTTGRCRQSSATDNPFMEIADATSGQMLSLTSNTELQKLTAFTGSVLGGSNIISSGLNISYRKKRAASTASRYDIKIDDSIGKISVCVTTDRPNQGAGISLTDPQGVVITSGKVSMSKVSIYELANPRVGTWTLVIPPGAGVHNYFVKSNSDQNIDFDYYFMMLIKRPASEVPVTDPLKGENNKIVITLAGNEKIRKNSVVLELITKHGQHIREIQLTPDSRGVRYTATFTPPSRPFKLKIKGTTKRGNLFERVSRSTVEPKYVQIRVLHSVHDFTLRRGTKSFVTFHLYNSANENKRVRIKVKDRLGYASISRTSRTISRTIRRKRWAFFRLSFTTPSSATIGTCDTAFISVSVDNGQEIVSQPVQLIVIA